MLGSGTGLRGRQAQEGVPEGAGAQAECHKTSTHAPRLPEKGVDFRRSENCSHHQFPHLPNEETPHLGFCKVHPLHPALTGKSQGLGQSSTQFIQFVGVGNISFCTKVHIQEETGWGREMELKCVLTEGIFFPWH